MAYVTKLTAVGATKIIGGTLNITQIAVGDSNGVPYVPNGSETALSNEVYRAAISGLIQNSGQLSMQLVIPTTQGGWWIREVGVFDADGDLVFIANIPAREKALDVTELTITLLATVSSGATINAMVDTGAYVTNDILQNGLDGKIDKVSGKGLSTNDYTNTEKSKLAGIETDATADEAATDMEAKEAIDSDKFMTPETTHVAYGASDPVVLTTSPHNQDITESILSGSASPMVINLADVTTYPKSKLNRIALIIANLSNDNWTVTPASIGDAWSEVLSITGSTTTSPTYALNTTNLPTVAGGAVASNVFTASANNASAQTFDYVASGTVESITPKMQFTPGSILTVDPASTTGSAKFNYSVSNQIQVGSKMLVDVDGTVNEITVAAGSQGSGSDVFGNTISHSVFQGNNNFLTFQNGKLYVSQDYSTWQYQSSTLNELPVGALHFYDGRYYAGTSAGVIYSSIDLITWSIAATITGLNIVNFAHDSTKILVAGLLSGNVMVYSSPDAITWTNRYSYSGGGYRSVYSFMYSIDRFVLAVGSNSPKISNDGITWTSLSNSPSGDCFSIVWTGSAYLHVSSDSVSYMCIWKSVTGSSWTRVLNLSNINAASITLNNGMLFCYFSENVSSQNYWTSSNEGDNWTLRTKGTSSGQAAPTFLNQKASFYFANNASKIGVFNSTTGLETDITPVVYQFTMTSPVITKPTWAALGGQAMQYSVSTTSTSSFTATTTPTYTRSGNVITATYTQVTGVTGSHIQLKALTLNGGDVLSQIGATLTMVARQTINGKTSMTIAAGKVVMMVPTSSGWLATN